MWSLLQTGVMAYRNQFFVGVIVGVLVSMTILGLLHLNNSAEQSAEAAHIVKG